MTTRVATVGLTALATAAGIVLGVYAGRTDGPPPEPIRPTPISTSLDGGAALHPSVVIL